MFNLGSNTRKSWQTVARPRERTGDILNGSSRMPPPHELGPNLRERREAMGATLAEVEAATRIRQKYLAALEADEWQLLPGEIVGRGFLRNYATYLGLDSNELVERRRSISDPTLASALFNTSAGSAMPADRTVDYRPKDVPLRDEPEAIQQREIRLAPFLTAIALFGALFLLWWGVSSFGRQIGTAVGDVVSGFQTRTASMPVEPTFTQVPTIIPAVALDNPVQQETATPAIVENNIPTNNNPNNNVPPNNNGPQTPPTVTIAIGPVLVPTSTPLDNAPSANNPPSVSTNGAADVTPAITATVATTIVTPTLAAAAQLPPTATPTATPEPPTPTPTETPTPIPTDTPVVVAPQCPDPRSVLTTPGVNQVVSGAIAVTGSAIHENFDYYKLEYALGANVAEGFVYFAGDKNQVQGGLLGGLDTTALPNGVYTLRLVVVDLTGNFPPPCQVTVTIQN